MLDQIGAGPTGQLAPVVNRITLSPCRSFAVIELHNSHRLAQIDAADVERAREHLWTLGLRDGKPYPRTTVWTAGAWMPISLGRFIAQPGNGKTVVYVDRSPLNARRGNLVVRRTRLRPGAKRLRELKIARQAEFQARAAEAMRRATAMASGTVSRARSP